MNDFAQSQGEIGENMDGRNDFQHRQISNRRESMRVEFQCGRSYPGAFQMHVLQVILDQFADARRAVHVGDNLEQVVGGLHCGFDGGEISFFVLIAHCGSHHAHGAVIQCAHHCVGFHMQ